MSRPRHQALTQAGDSLAAQIQADAPPSALRTAAIRALEDVMSLAYLAAKEPRFKVNDSPKLPIE